MRRRCTLHGQRAECIEAGSYQHKTEGQPEDGPVLVQLAHQLGNVLDMPIRAVLFGEWTACVLGDCDENTRDQNAEDALPPDHIERVLTLKPSDSVQDELLCDCQIRMH